MNVPRYATEVARLLSARLGDTAPPPGDRARGAASIERAIRARQKSRGVRVALLAAAAFAVFAGAAVGVGRFARLSSAETEARVVEVRVSPRGAGAIITPGNALHTGDRLLPGAELRVNSGGTAALALSTGSRLDLESDAAVTARTLASQQRFYLSRGALEARVAKLGAGERFVVETPDAEIEVRGTEFRLEVPDLADACDSNVRTRLLVREGVVEVRSGNRVARIAAGGRWPDCHEPKREALPKEKPVRDAPSEQPAVGHVLGEESASPRAKVEISAPGSTSSPALVEQNDLFAEGVAARKRGDTPAAVSAYGRLIEKYPGSALVENAMVERMRLFGRSDSAAARREAARYLERYPSGFARAEANRLLLSSP